MKVSQGKSKTHLFLACFVVAAIAVSIFSGCSSSSSGSSKALTKVNLQIKWLPQSQFMGYYVAQQKGYFKQEGLDVNIISGGSDIIPEQQVNNGVANIGVTWTSSLMKYQEKGWNLKEISQTFQKSGMLLVSKKSSNINSVADLKGKKVSSWFGGNEYELYALLGKNNLNKDKDVTLVQQDFTMNQLISGQVNAAQAMTYNEYGLLLENGLKDSDINTIDMNNAGVAMLEDCLFVKSDWASKNKETLVKFLKAANKGWADACDDPDSAGSYIYTKNKSVSLAHQKYMAEQVAKLVETSDIDESKIGYMDNGKIQQTADLGLKYGLLSKAIDVSKVYDTTYWKEATENNS
ncbi:MAG TPA: myristoyl transferase [Ruminococcaceae bacterium]|nr:myristoyl transferase [Oscillospiraceae bacterium]